MSAISASLDQLAWDIKSQEGAACRSTRCWAATAPRCPAYASTVTWDTMDEYERYIKQCIDVGFTAFKLHAWGDAKEDAEALRATCASGPGPTPT